MPGGGVSTGPSRRVISVADGGSSARAGGELFSLDVDDGDVVFPAGSVGGVDQRLDHLLRPARPSRRRSH